MTLSIACPEGTVQGGGDQDRALGVLAAFRRELYWCFSKRPDGLAELADAVLCKPDRVHMLAELSLVPECRRGHGAVYDAVNSGRVQIGRLRRSLAALPFPAWADGRIRLAVDVSNWLRPDAETSPDRLFCHTYARGKGNAQMIPGWPYSFVAALEPGRTSWTLLLDAVRLGAADDATEVTARQVREVVARIIDAGHWHDGDPDILVIFDAGYDLTRLAWLLAGLPVGCWAGCAATGSVLPGASARTGHERPARPARCRGQARGRAVLAGPAGHHRHRDHPVRHRRRHGVGPAAPAADQPRRLGGPRRGTAGHRGNPHPAARQPPARQPQPGTTLAMDHRRPAGRRDSQPQLAGVPAPVRHRAHVQVPETGSRLDPPEAA